MKSWVAVIGAALLFALTSPAHADLVFDYILDPSAPLSSEGTLITVSPVAFNVSVDDSFLNPRLLPFQVKGLSMLSNSTADFDELSITAELINTDFVDHEIYFAFSNTGYVLSAPPSLTWDRNLGISVTAGGADGGADNAATFDTCLNVFNASVDSCEPRNLVDQLDLINRQMKVTFVGPGPGAGSVDDQNGVGILGAPYSITSTWDVTLSPGADVTFTFDTTLRPETETVPAPEPASLALFAPALLGLAFLTSHKRSAS
jgi:hypothetical protein